jgi:hypothetical protein
LTTNPKSAVFVVIILAASQWSAAQDGQGSPHWNEDKCQMCHVDAMPVAGNISLNEADAESLCETCHGDRGDALPCRHASGISIGDISISDALRGSLKDEKVVCSTCHDVVYQCERPKQQFSSQNRGFLRDRTSRESGDYCLKCHDSSDYEKLSPHAGIARMPPRPTCLLCHANIPATSDTGQLIVEFNMEHDLNDICQGCHAVRPHPKGMSFFAARQTEEWVHFVAPSEEVLGRMREFQAESGLVVPLNPQNGEVFCATCHNPHDFKIGGEHGSEVRDTRYRLRLNNICQACHDK